MPSTTELINYLKLQAEGWNRTGEKGLLEVLNQAQDMLFLQDNAQEIAYRSDGDLPYITTTSETYEYTLTQAVTGLSDDIWRVDNVLVKASFPNDLPYDIVDEYGLAPLERRPVQRVEYNGIEYFRFYQIQCIDAKKGSDPLLRFTTNPGDTTTTFFLVAYKKPTKLLSEAIQPSLPEHLHFSCLLPTALKLVEGYQNGTIIESMDFIERVYKPKVQSELNEGDQGFSGSVTRYEE